MFTVRYIPLAYFTQTNNQEITAAQKNIHTYLQPCHEIFMGVCLHTHIEAGLARSGKTAGLTPRPQTQT